MGRRVRDPPVVGMGTSGSRCRGRLSRRERASDPPALGPSRCRPGLAGCITPCAGSSAGKRGRNPSGLGIRAGRGTTGAHLRFARRASVEDRISVYICCSQHKRTLGKHCILSGLSSRSEFFQYWPCGALLLNLMSVCKCVLCVDKFFTTYWKADQDNCVVDLALV